MSHAGKKNVRLQEPIAMPVNLRNCRIIGYRYMIWLYANKFSVFFMCLVHGQIPLPPSALQQQPEVSELCWKGARSVANAPIPEVW